MSAESRRRFAEALRAPEPDLGLACLLIAAEAHPDLDVGAWQRRLDELAAAARSDVPPAGSAYDVAQGLRRSLGDTAGFRGYGADYGDLRGSLLHEVLRRRRGLPILLSIVYIEVARRLGVPVHGIGVAGHFVVGVPGPDGTLMVDPFYGGRLVSRGDLAGRVSDLAGRPVELTDDDLAPWTAGEIVTRVLANVRAVSRRADAMRVRLWAVDLSLLVPGAAVDLHRERGDLLMRLGDFLGAAAEFEVFAAAVAPTDPEAADHALRAARMGRARLC